MLAKDVLWCQLIEEDFVWMWKQLRGASSLCDPATSLAPWLTLKEHSPDIGRDLFGEHVSTALGNTGVSFMFADSMLMLFLVFVRFFKFVQQHPMKHRSLPISTLVASNEREGVAREQVKLLI